MQLILDCFKRIFEALSGVYSKAEADAALGLKADATALTEEATARKEADKQAAEERESARLREQWKSQTYAEFRFVNTSTTKTQYDLFKITANGAWWVDFGDGNGAQLQTELEATPVLDFGSDTERLVRFYGPITEISCAESRTDDDTIRVRKCVIDGEALTKTSTLVKYITDKDTEICIFAHNANISLGSRGADSYQTPSIGVVDVNALGFSAGFTDMNNLRVCVQDGKVSFSAMSVFNIYSIAFFSPSTVLTFAVSNLAIRNRFVLDSFVSSTTTDLRFLFKVEPDAEVIIRLSKLSNAPNFFSGYSKNLFSLKQMLPTLESLPVWSDGKAHNFGIHCYYTETTDTFTATDSDGVEYSLENCPSFDEDDAEQTFRKAYVLTIAKNGWTILLKNKNA